MLYLYLMAASAAAASAAAAAAAAGIGVGASERVYLSQYVAEAELNRSLAAASPEAMEEKARQMRREGASRASKTPSLIGRVLVMDFPIKGLDRFIARTCLRLHRANYGHFGLAVANEGAAIVAALLAAGYTPLEIISLRVSGQLDVTTLIEGGQKLPDALHVNHKGAAHKGHRLRDRIDELIRVKIGGDSSKPVTLAELRSAGTRLPLHITVLDLDLAAVVTLSHATHPTMAVADAVLASCAVQPYIGRVQVKLNPPTEASSAAGSAAGTAAGTKTAALTASAASAATAAAVKSGKSKPVTYQFVSCSQTQSLPILTAQSLYSASSIVGNFINLLVGFGYNAATPSIADAAADQAMQRAAAAYSTEMNRCIALL